MNFLHFIFLNGDVVVYDATCAYERDGEYHLFEYEDISYKVKLEGSVEFWRETSNEKFVIRDDHTCEMEFKDLNRTFEIPVERMECIKKDESYTIKYELSSDVGIEKKIILKFGI